MSYFDRKKISVFKKKNIKYKLHKYFRSECKSLICHNKFMALFNPNQIISCAK